MRVLNNILIALDFKTDEEKAKIDHAIALTQSNESTTITLFTVVPEVTFDPEKDIVPAEKKQGLLLNKAKEQLDNIADTFIQGTQITCLAVVGTPSVEIVRQVLKGGHDLLLTSTRKEKAVKDHLLGSTMVELMRQCPCPVWAIKPETVSESKIMVGIHFDEEVEDHNDSLNHRLLDIACLLAKDTNEEIHLVNIVKQSNDELTAERLIELNKLPETLSNVTSKIVPVVLEGDVVVEVPEYTREQSIDILVMGMLSRTGLKGFFIGNTAEKIMDDIDCSLLVVKPKEFVSQITI